jgi:glutamine amidotransferase
MCRLISYIGAPVAPASLILVPPHSLIQQCRAPRHQTRTNDNPDGFGLAWFDGDANLHRYRRATPMWEDHSFTAVASDARTSCFVGAIRKATPGIALGEENTPPYVRDGWIFAHNGSIDGWVEGNDVRARGVVSEARAAEIEGTTDSEMLFAAILTRIDEGEAPHTAVGGVVAMIGGRFGGWLNVVLTDGEQIVATTWRNSLFILEHAGTTVIASEPYDDDLRWRHVADQMLVHATRDATSIEPIQRVQVSP